jgi:hypothetical protein
VAGVVQPGVDRRRAFESVEPAERLRQQAQPGREELALEGASARVLERRDQKLVGQPPAVRGQHDEAAALDDDPLARSKLCLEVTAD